MNLKWITKYYLEENEKQEAIWFEKKKRRKEECVSVAPAWMWSTQNMQGDVKGIKLFL